MSTFFAALAGLFVGAVIVIVGVLALGAAIKANENRTVKKGLNDQVREAIASGDIDGELFKAAKRNAQRVGE